MSSRVKVRWSPEAAALAQTLTTHYFIPIGDPALEKLGFEGTIEKKKLADLDTENYDFEPSITQVRGRWQAKVTRPSRKRSESALSMPGMLWAWRPISSDLRPVSGWVLTSGRSGTGPLLVKP